MAAVFGLGIVATPDDFGNQGARPTHPELLDWLAVTFRENDQWEVKAFIKRMVLSATYRQSSKLRPELLEMDQPTVYWPITPDKNSLLKWCVTTL